MNSNPYHW